MQWNPCRTVRTLAAALVAVGLAAAHAHAEDTKAEAKTDAKTDRYVVKSFAAKGAQASDAASLESSFCAALGEQKLDVLCPEDVRSLLSERQQRLGLQVGAGDEADDENIARLAELTKATRVVTGELSKLGDSYILTVTLLDPTNSKVLARASERVNKVESLLDKLDGVARKLVSGK